MEATKVPTQTGPIRTIADLVAAADQHIADILDGKITDGQARNVRDFRKVQLRAAEMQIQYARLFKGRTPDAIMPLLTPAETTPVSSRLTPEEAEQLKRLQEKAAG